MHDDQRGALAPLLRQVTKLVWAFVAFFVITVVAALIHSNVTKLAEANHWDGFLIQVWQPLGPLIGFLIGQHWFWFLAGLSAGLLLGIGAGKFLAKSAGNRKAMIASTESATGAMGKIDFEGIEGANKVETENDVWVRARVRNMGPETLKNARVYLTSLKEVHSSGATTQTSLHDALPLPWAGADFNPRELPCAPDFHHYVDLMHVSKHEPGWIIWAQQVFADLEKLKRYRGTYRFQVTLTADGAKPVTCEVDVSYFGDWHNLRAVAAPIPLNRS